MLSRSARLSNARDFARIYRHGRSARSDFFRLNWLASQRVGARIAIITSRKLSTKAVRRNLLKRQVRSILREFYPALERIDLIIQLLPRTIQVATAKHRDTARQSVMPTLTFARLKDDLEKLLKKNNLLN